MLIDGFMPHCDFSERHTIVTSASPERAYEAIRRTDLRDSWIVRMLLTLRGMGRQPARTTLGFAEGFTIAAEAPPREVVIGIEGPFWNPRCRPRGVDAATFLTAVPPKTARAAWNFSIDVDGGNTRVTTETRVLCSDDARRKFAIYWTLIRPFSGLIRIMMLRAIRKEAERGS